MALAQIRKAAQAADWNGAEIISRNVGAKANIAGYGTILAPQSGVVIENDKFVPVETATVDTSTGADTAAETITTVEDGRVLITSTIRDLTAQEMDEQQTARVASEADMVLAKALFKLLNDFRESQSLAPVSVAQFKAWMKAQL